MRRNSAILICVLLAVVPAKLQAQDHHHSVAPSPYAGMETRAIKSLSESDIDQLKRGAGWKLALPAELNGVPGPAHLLELKDEIGLSADQVAKIEAIYAAMKTEAIAAGENLIAAEAEIDNAFGEGTIDEQQLRLLIDRSEAARADLRFIHLSRHLLTPPLLTDRQIESYKVLRGYAPVPCANMAEGHAALGDHQHDGCE